MMSAPSSYPLKVLSPAGSSSEDIAQTRHSDFSHQPEEPESVHTQHIRRKPVHSGTAVTDARSSLMEHGPDSLVLRPSSVDSDPTPFATRFDRKRQVVRLSLYGLIRFLFTVILVAGLYVTFIGYRNHGIIGENGKRIYNALLTGLSMTLGISLASSLKLIALNFRWYILSRKKRSVNEVNSILACDSLTEIALLVVKSLRQKKLGLSLSCGSWVILNIAAQAAIAMLSLTVSLNPGTDYTKPVLGNVVYSNMSTSFGSRIGMDSIDSSQLAAHTYGTTALEFNANLTESTNMTLLPVPQLAPYLVPTYFESIESSYFQYVFAEIDSDPNSITSYFFSNRSVATISQCKAYSVIDNLNGSSQSFHFNKGGKVETQDFQSIGPRSTTFYTSPNLGNCGPRCANVCAYENNGTKGWYYECEVLVGNVTNARRAEQQVPDSHAKMAAGAIALQGYQARTADAQFQQFPAASAYGVFLDGNASQMARNMRQFAVGVFTTADWTLQNIENPVPGWVPDQGLIFQFDHASGMWAIFCSIIGWHLLLYVLSTWYANRVIVPDGDDMTTALLLRPVAEAFAEKGCLLDRAEREKAGEDYEVVYGPVSDQKNLEVKGLEISSEADCVRDARRWEGYYDA